MANVYIIPENFIEGGKILNMFKTRNFVEAVILTALTAGPLWIIPQYPSFQMKLMLVLCVAAPVFMISAAGINDDSVIQFLQQFIKWRKNKRIMLYNGQLRSRELRAADVILAQELTKDKLVNVVETWQEKRRAKNADVSLVEGVDFVFMDDETAYSSYTATEQRMLNQTEKDEVHT